MGFISEFKDFAIKGNVMDMAVGVIIGGAFGKIVSSAIDDLIMPIVGKIIGNVDFSNLYIPLSDKITANLSLAEAILSLETTTVWRGRERWEFGLGRISTNENYSYWSSRCRKNNACQTIAYYPSTDESC